MFGERHLQNSFKTAAVQLISRLCCWLDGCGFYEFLNCTYVPYTLLYTVYNI